MKRQSCTASTTTRALSCLAEAAAISLVLAVCLTLSASAQGTNPFVGTWRWNPERSHLENQSLTIRPAGERLFTFDDHMGKPVTLAENGQPRQLPEGGTMVLDKIDSTTWRLTVQGELSSVKLHKLSSDGNRIDRQETIQWANGSREDRATIWQRVGSGNGLTDEWMSTKVDTKAAQKPWELTMIAGGNGTLVVKMPAYGTEYTYRFDGKQYPDSTPHARNTSTFATRKLGDRAIDLEVWLNGAPAESTQF